MTFGELKERIAELLGREAFTMAYSMAEATLSRDLRILGMQSTATLAASGGSLTLPVDFEDIRDLMDPGGCPVLAIESGSRATASGFVLRNGSLRLFPAPEDGAEYALTYFATLTPLEDDSDTNAALSGALDAYVFTVLAHHYTLIRNVEAAAGYVDLAANQIAAANSHHRRQWASGVAIAPSRRGAAV